MTLEQAKKWWKKAFHNAEHIERHTRCGCYMCCRRFNTKQITEWADKGKTALCPHCGLDGLLAGRYTVRFLAQIANHLYKPSEE